jgi:hypothetical protein
MLSSFKVDEEYPSRILFYIITELFFFEKAPLEFRAGLGRLNIDNDSRRREVAARSEHRLRPPFDFAGRLA